MIKRARERKCLFLIILFLGFTTCIYAPFEMYCNNAGDFWFRLADFWWIPLLCGFAAMAGAACLGMLLKGNVLAVYEALLFGSGLGAYVQSNFINLNAGQMDGRAILWENYRVHMAWNLFTWLLCLAAPVIFALLCRKKGSKLWKLAEGGISALLTAMQLTALAVLMAPVIATQGKAENIGYLSDRDLMRVSGEENIIVFVVDSLDDLFFKEMLAQEPALAEELDGFTHFSNSTGNYSTTQYSLLYLATGKYFYNQMSWSDWKKTVGHDENYLNSLKDNEFELGIYLQNEMTPDSVKKQAVNYDEVPLRINYYRNFTMDLYRFVMCKYFPDFVKPMLWMEGNEFNKWQEPASDYATWKADNFQLKDELEKASLTADSDKKQFKFIHISGSHPPLNMDENCNRTWAGEVTPTQCGRGSLRLVQTYMKEMKELGVYDNSSIIIMADHGYYLEGALSNPVLLVKQKGQKGKLKENKAPVSQREIPATILSFAGLADKADGEKSVFEIQPGEKRDRRFYQYYLNYAGPNDNCRLIEYAVEDVSSEYDSYHLTDVEYTWDGVKREHIPYCKVCSAGGPTKEQLKEHDPPRIVHRLIDSNY